VWLDAAARAQWGLPDPSRVSGSVQEIDSAFSRAMRSIESRINRLLQEPFEGARSMELTELQKRIGEHN
jgi:arsenate reductase